MNGAITRLSHVALTTPDPQRLVAHYRDIIGLADYEHADGDTYLASGGAGPALQLRSGSSPALDHIAFELSPAAEEQFLAHLRQRGVSASKGSDAEPGIARVHEVSDVEGNRVQLCVIDEARAPAKPATSGVVPQKIGHVAARTTSAEAVTEFYEGALGFKWSDWMGDFFVFLRCNADHHAVNFINASRPGELHHVAFEVPDAGRVIGACDVLAAHEVPLVWGPGRHGIGHNLFTYHHDPDGNVVEIFCDIDRMVSEELGYFEPRPWHKERPQRPKRWVPDPASANQWGPGPPEDFQK